MEQIARETIGEIYLEEDPSVTEWFRGFVPCSGDVGEYVRELFPCAGWVRRYCWGWAVGDLVAGMFDFLFILGWDGRWYVRVLLTKYRYYCWACGCATGDGVCTACAVIAGIWAVHDIYWSVFVLGIWDVEGYRHRCEYQQPNLY